MIRGSKNVLNHLTLFLKTIFNFSAGEVLFIAAGVGDSAFYRAYNQSEELNLHGIKSSVTLQDNPFLVKRADKFKIFIFHRTLFTPALGEFISRIKERKKEIIFETDDLVFDAGYIQAADLYKNKMNAAEKTQYKNGIGAEILKDSYAKVCVTTTAYLGEILKGCGKKVFVSRNKISNRELEIADDILKNIPKEKDGYIRIGYFSGTASHNKDFAYIIPAIAVILEKYPKTKLYLAGPLDIENQLDIYKSRIIILPFVPRERYYENLWKVDINLAPLVPNDPFCEAKSEIKFIEPGILGIPTVAIKNGTFSGVMADGVNGFLAENKEEWVEKIGYLIENAELRKKIGQNAREKVLRDYTNKNSHNEEFYEYLRNRIKAIK